MSVFHELLVSRSQEIERRLEAALDREIRFYETIRPRRLLEAMQYSVLGGGKRIRPFLVMESAALFGINSGQSVHAAAALECIHCYSLVHDDLPAMDDDDLRRGKPTTHKAFNEATAILAGDGLLTLAFDILTDQTSHKDAGVRAELVQLYAQNAGPGGMVGGQALDLEAENGNPDEDEILTLQSMKTGALIRCACEAGAVLGQTSPDEKKALFQYGKHIGQAFQLVDDILDVTSDTKTMGKQTAKDADKGKGTLVGLKGVEECRRIAQSLLDQAVSSLDPFGSKASILAETARFMVERKN